MKKKEVLFIVGILLLSLLLFALQSLTGRGKCSSVRITAGGEVLGVYSLSEDQVIQIGETNVCEIKDGEVRMTQASCPDQYCIHQAPVGQKGGVIICLPNKVIIEGIGADPEEIREIDAVV